MRTISYVTVGDCLSRLDSLGAGRNVVFVTDAIVRQLYVNIFERHPTIVIPAGEASKTIQTYHTICRRLLEIGADRRTLLVGVGGGVVTDLTGFVGATYMRGIDFGFVATTLLSQVDAAIGGKNGVDVDGYKNIVGTFVEPSFVLCDPLFLGTQHADQIAEGYAEIIKYALLTDLSMLDNPTAPVERCVGIKMEIVGEDFRDTGRRKLLNLGHTFAHAIEKCSAQTSHGRAVGAGLCIAARISAGLGYLDRSVVETIEQVVVSHHLPIEADHIDSQQLIQAVLKDKKRVDGGLEMILLRDIGDTLICNLGPVELADAYDSYR